MFSVIANLYEKLISSDRTVGISIKLKIEYIKNTNRFLLPLHTRKLKHFLILCLRKLEYFRDKMVDHSFTSYHKQLVPNVVSICYSVEMKDKPKS